MGLILAKAFRQDIQGLRAVAVILVLVFHAFPESLPGGFVGVDVFFVISGFVITQSLVRDMDLNGVSAGPMLVRFYGKRIRRILPALAVVLVATLAAGWLILVPSDYAAVAKSALYSAAGAGNLFFYWNTGYFDAAAAKQPLLHMWSLGVEEQFYLVWPLALALILGLTGRKRHLAAGAIAVLIMSVFVYSAGVVAENPKAGFYLPLPRAWELGVGSLLAFVPAIRWRWVSEILGFSGLSLILWAGLTLEAGETSTGWPMVPAILGASMLIWPKTDTWAGRLLEIAILRGMGAISYSLYLWHWPMLVYAALIGMDSPAERVVNLLASVALATLTYVLIERPSLHFRWWSMAVPGAISGTAVAAAFAGAVVLTGGMPLRYPPDIRPVLALGDYDYSQKTRYPTCWLTGDMGFASYDQDCSIGQVLIWGDSHAAMLSPGMRSKLGDVAQYTRSGCLPIIADGDDPCFVGNRAILNKIREIRPKTVVLYAAWLNHPVEWQTGWPDEAAFRKTIRSLFGAGVQEVKVIGPTPNWDPSLPSAVLDYWNANGSLPDRLPPSAKPYEAVDNVLRRIAGEEGAIFLSAYRALCETRGCRTHTENSVSDLIIWDYGHLTWQGADYLADKLF